MTLINLRIITFSAQYLHAEYQDYNDGVDSFFCYDRQMHLIESGPEKGLLIRCEDYDKYFTDKTAIKFYNLKERK